MDSLFFCKCVFKNYVSKLNNTEKFSSHFHRFYFGNARAGTIFSTFFTICIFDQYNRFWTNGFPSTGVHWANWRKDSNSIYS